MEQPLDVLNLQSDQVVPFGSFTEFAYHYVDVFGKQTFEVFWDLADKQTLVYHCRFENPEQAEELYKSTYVDSDEEFNIQMDILNQQPVIILDKCFL